MDDLRAVMDSVDSERALLWTAQEGARLAALFGATYPERTAGLVLLYPTARGRRSADYPWAPSDAEWRTMLAEIRDGWGTTEYLAGRLEEWAPTLKDDPEFRAWFISHMRRGLSPGSALSFFRMMMDSDVSDVLPAVRVPTIVFAKPNERAEAAYFAQKIPSARLIELPRDPGIYHWVDEDVHELVMHETKALAEYVQHEAAPKRLLATVLFTDVVGSTERAAELGDSEWRNLVTRHHAHVRRCLAVHGGTEVDVAGDGFLATFDGPGRAIACARAIVSDLGELDLPIRTGVHTGECELVDGKVVGIAVNIGARIASGAAPGEVLVSSTVKDLVAGSRLAFEDRGERELKGVGAWRLYAVSDA
jgi:class 3 adenylate cyclase